MAMGRDVSIKLGDIWTFYFDNGPPRGITKPVWEEYVKELGSFGTIQSFWRYWNTIMKRLPLPDYSNLRLFKEGIRPLWEDPANKNGGKWTIPCPKDQSIETWSEIVFAVIGEQLDDHGEICGMVLAVRPKGDNIHIWHRDADSRYREKIQQRILEFIPFDDLKPKLSYVPHTVSQDYMNRDLQKVETKKGKQSRGGRGRKTLKQDDKGYDDHEDSSVHTAKVGIESDGQEPTEAAALMKRDWGSRDIFDAALRERRAWGSLDLSRHARSSGFSQNLPRVFSANKLSTPVDETMQSQKRGFRKETRQWGSVDSKQGDVLAEIRAESLSARTYSSVVQNGIRGSSSNKSLEYPEAANKNELNPKTPTVDKNVGASERENPREEIGNAENKSGDSSVQDSNQERRELSSILSDEDLKLLEELERERARRRKEKRKKAAELGTSVTEVDFEERSRKLQQQIYLAGIVCILLTVALIAALVVR